MGVVKIPVDNDDDDHYEKMITAIQSNYVTVITVSLPQMLEFATLINQCSTIKTRTGNIFYGRKFFAS